MDHYDGLSFFGPNPDQAPFDDYDIWFNKTTGIADPMNPG
jgi:hypothetical protein